MQGLFEVIVSLADRDVAAGDWMSLANSCETVSLQSVAICNKSLCKPGSMSSFAMS